MVVQLAVLDTVARADTAAGLKNVGMPADVNVLGHVNDSVMLAVGETVTLGCAGGH